MADENHSKSSFFQRLRSKLPFGNGLAQLITFIGIQGINILKAIKLNYKVAFDRLATIAGPLSKASIIFAGITVLIENILNFKKIWDMPPEVDKVQKNKTYVDTFIGLLKAVAVGVFTAVTFGVAGAFLLAAVLALPVLMLIDCFCDLCKIGYDLYVFYGRRQAAEFEGQQGESELKAAKDNLINSLKILAAKGAVLVGAILTLLPFPPVELAGYGLIILGFGYIVQKVCSAQETGEGKEVPLPESQESQKKGEVSNDDGELTPTPAPKSRHVPTQPPQVVHGRELRKESSVSLADSLYSFFSAVGNGQGIQWLIEATGMSSTPPNPNGP